jgi:hypothetical protein
MYFFEGIQNFLCKLYKEKFEFPQKITLPDFFLMATLPHPNTLLGFIVI